MTNKEAELYEILKKAKPYDTNATLGKIMGVSGQRISKLVAGLASKGKIKFIEEAGTRCPLMTRIKVL